MAELSCPTDQIEKIYQRIYIKDAPLLNMINDDTS